MHYPVIAHIFRPTLISSECRYVFIFAKNLAFYNRILNSWINHQSQDCIGLDLQPQRLYWIFCLSSLTEKVLKRTIKERRPSWCWIGQSVSQFELYKWSKFKPKKPREEIDTSTEHLIVNEMLATAYIFITFGWPEYSPLLKIVWWDENSHQSLCCHGDFSLSPCGEKCSKKHSTISTRHTYLEICCCL